MQTTVLHAVTPYSLVDIYRNFRRTWYQHHQEGKSINIDSEDGRTGTEQSVQWLGCGLDVWRVAVRFPREAKDFPLLHSDQTGYGAQLHSYAMGTDNPRAGVQRPRREPHHLSQPSVELKNEWRYTSIPPYLSIACRGTILPLITLMVEAADSSETLLLIQHSTRCHMSED